MSWYKAGTVTSVAGTNIITGAGTIWNNPIFGIASGQMIFVPGAGQVVIYEILAVDSDTKIRVTGNITPTIINSEYAIVTTVSNSMSDLARRTAVQLALYQKLLEDWQNITTGTGDVTIIAPDGTEVVIPALSWITDSKTWFDANRELIENAGEAVAGAETARDQAVAANTAAQAAKTTAVSSANTASTAATTATGAATTATSAASTATTSKNQAVTARDEAVAAAASVNLGPLGIGLASIADIANFDWLSFPFLSGANYLASYNSWLNAPPELTFNAGTRVSITVDYIATNGTRIGLTVIPDTGAQPNYRVFKVLSVGAPGSRVFTVRQDWNSAIPVPITGGGTGGNTPATGRTGLGLGDAATKNVGTTAGTVAAGDDSRFGSSQLSTTLYPGGTPAAPLYITGNQRIAVTNPFSGRLIACRAEVFYGTNWGESGWDGNTGASSPTAYGTVAVIMGVDMVIISGSYAPLATSSLLGNGFQIGGASVPSVAVRLVVWTID